MSDNPPDPCVGLSGPELIHCRLIQQYAAGCASQTAAIASAKASGLINAAIANKLTRYVEHGEEKFKEEIGA